MKVSVLLFVVVEFISINTWGMVEEDNSGSDKNISEDTTLRTTVKKEECSMKLQAYLLNPPLQVIVITTDGDIYQATTGVMMGKFYLTVAHVLPLYDLESISQIFVGHPQGSFYKEVIVDSISFNPGQGKDQCLLKPKY
ncbi:hypothetical protein [Endozoicomonas sp. 8E]|uniref:hypothetical protein n=1 Tax=Endozoicomonas sp. 8E TaxID=3035692 RepID=UPI002938D534|nr:hypothetical protein [Endozoicomonas sp. 8E]WOG29777.1 hypothetical protein P6910_09005 [Endozoicomonas sp. 8E]